MAVREALAESLAAAYPRAQESELRSRIDALLDAAESRGLTGEPLEKQVDSWILQLPRRQVDWVGFDAALVDLQHLLVGPLSGWGRIWRELRRFASFASAHWAPFVTFVIGVAGAFYGAAYARFYARLDVTPDQVGLAPAQIVTQSLIGGLVLVLLILIGFFCIVLPLIPMKEQGPPGGAGSWKRVLANGVLTLTALVLLVGLCALVDIATKASLQLFALILASFFVWGSLRLTGARWRVRIRPAPLDFSLDRYGVVLTACAVPALLITILATFALADELGERASVGKAVRDPKVGIFPLLGIRAEPALVTWKRPTESVSPTRCMLYLGSSEGKVTLYDHRRSSTFHISGDELTLQVKSEMSSCEAPTNVLAPSILPFGEGKWRCQHGRWRSRVDSDYSYSWVLDGHPLEDDGRGKPWLLYEEGFEGSVVYCKVTAETPLGEDVAISGPLVVGDRKTLK